MRSRVAEGIATLFPGYFALVMATGIVSIAAFLLGMEGIAWVLLAINLAAYLPANCARASDPLRG